MSSFLHGKTRVGRPTLIQIGMICSPIVAALGIAFVFTQEYPPLTYAAVLLVQLLLGATGIGLIQERDFARYTALGFWAALVLSTLAQWSDGFMEDEQVQGAAGYVVLLGIAGWYFFKDEGVVAYYDEIAVQDGDARPEP